MVSRTTRTLGMATSALLAVAGVVALVSTTRVEPLAVYAQLPEFELVDQDGDAFGSADLQGRVWVANFIFTSCATVCPRLTLHMRDLQNKVAGHDDIHLVSISVDPVRDTPERLRQYAQRFEVDFATWSFLTGPLEDIEKTVQQGFLMTMQQEPASDTGFFNIVHGERFVLIDRQGRIRGYFDATDEGMAKLLRAARQLVNEPTKAVDSPAVVS